MMTKFFGNNFGVFSKENLGSVRTLISSNGTIWFAGRDVCNILGIKNASNAYARLMDNEKAIIHSMDDGGNNASYTHPVRLTIVSESGLYMLIMSSRKSEAVIFQRWITQEVLPSIRKNGGYILGQELLPSSELEKEVKALSSEVARLTAERTEERFVANMFSKYYDETLAMYQKLMQEHKIVLSELEDVTAPIPTSSQKEEEPVRYYDTFGNIYLSREDAIEGIRAAR